MNHVYQKRIDKRHIYFLMFQWTDIYKMSAVRIGQCYCKILHFLLLSVLIQVFCNGQGRLIHPPSRASMWRYGYSTKPDYRDDNVNCGGFEVQWRQNQGRCGYCGDRWDIPEPRPHERGGTFARGILVANFTQGQNVTLTVHLTRRRPSIHTGYFEYRLCPRNHLLTLEDDQCFQHLLELASSPGTTRAEVSSGMGKVSHDYRLPSDVTCTACVLQWRYVIDTGKSKPQYRACADIAIHPSKVPTTWISDDLTDYPRKPTTSIIGEKIPERVIVDEEEHDSRLFEKKSKEKGEEKGENSSPSLSAHFCFLIFAIILPFTLIF
ncbi:uncharacterized protein LOC143038738 [Oratosquilla oratoria]|uniref:uncharacterized protein LOC143038738 n=1 Tax=Oratosquilla oratoria TaxID=337810 RepID=UPI003F762A51